VDTLRVLRIAEQFDSKKLCDECCAYLSPRLKECTICELYEFTRHRDINETLVKEAFKFILRKIVNIYRYFPRTLAQLSHHSLLEIIKSEDLIVSTEYYVFEIVSTWVILNQKTYEESKDLWDLVRFPFIDIDRLRNLVRPSAPMTRFIELQKSYTDCLEYNLSSEESKSLLAIPDGWRTRRPSYKESDTCHASWNVNWADLLNISACKNFDLQGYKATIFVRRRPENELMIMFFPVYSKHATCLRAEADLKIYNTSGKPVTPILHQEPRAFKRESNNGNGLEKKQVTNNACAVWKYKIVDPGLILNDTLIVNIQARVLT